MPRAQLRPGPQGAVHHRLCRERRRRQRASRARHGGDHQAVRDVVVREQGQGDAGGAVTSQGIERRQARSPGAAPGKTSAGMDGRWRASAAAVGRNGRPASSSRTPWRPHGSEECFAGRPEISAGRRAGRRHRRSVAAQAAARPVPSRAAPASSPAAASSASRWTIIDADGFRTLAREALDQFSTRKVNEADWAAFAADPRLCAAVGRRRRPQGGGRGGRAVARPARAGACTI